MNVLEKFREKGADSEMIPAAGARNPPQGSSALQGVGVRVLMPLYALIFNPCKNDEETERDQKQHRKYPHCNLSAGRINLLCTEKNGVTGIR